MKKRILMMVLLLGVLLFNGGLVNATLENRDIYSDAIIESGDYGTVNIYDSLDTIPVQTTVTMTGGEIDYCHVYNTAILNFEGGDIFVVISHDDSNVTVDATTLPTVFELYDDSKVHLHNGFNTPNIQIFDNAELHVYGYGFEYDPTITGTNGISGFWENGEAFSIGLRQPSDYDPYTQIILHEIPEPTTLLLFTFGGLFLRKHHKHQFKN